MKKLIVTLMAMALVFALLPAASAVVDPTYNEVWDGRGSTSMYCDKAGQGPVDENGQPLRDAENGWIHWIFNTKGSSTNAMLVLGGTGSGTYYPAEPLSANTWHFYTPYFDPAGLTATISLYGGDKGTGGGLVISDYCPGNGGIQELIDVSKTATTSYTRTHDWSIDKSVATEKRQEHEGYPKIWLYTDGTGDETATWTVDVTYDGYTDSDHVISGDITITNSANVDIVVDNIVDTLAGTPIDVDCVLPITVPAGQQLICSYSEEGFVEGSNVVDVTYHIPGDVQVTETATTDIVWGEPTTEVDKIVTVKDLSDLFDEVELGTATAPNDASFIYTKDFAWEDYGESGFGDYTYENTATIVETGQSASETLKVNVQGYDYETAYAKGDDAICFTPTFSNWGWTNPIGPGTYTWNLWAGAAQCDTSKGTLVGTVAVDYGTNGYVTASYTVNPPNILKETHVYAGTTMFPVDKKGKLTVAPGAYYNVGPFVGPIYVIAHAVVEIPDPDFGPQV